MKNFSSKKYLPTHAQLLHSGDEYFITLCKLIDEASREIIFQVYIFDNDETGNVILTHLRNAIARGVKVRVLVDAFGSGNLSYNFIEQLNKDGISIRSFEPFFSGIKFHVGRRLHHKVFVADESVALVGGINISNRYRGVNEKPWLDFAILLRGNICRQLASVCRKIEVKNFLPPNFKSSPVPTQSGNFQTQTSSELNEVSARVRQTDWVRGKNQIRNSYQHAIKSSEKNVLIIASYFIPGTALRRALRAASRRGVEIRILLSEKSDVPFAKGATEYLYDWLLRNNIRLFEYQTAIVHGKLMAVDGQWLTVGSYNLNHLSDYSSIELNIDVQSESFVKKFLREAEVIISTQCHEITLSEFQQKGFLSRIKNWFSYQLVRFNFSVLFFFQSKRKLNHIE